MASVRGKSAVKAFRTQGTVIGVVSRVIWLDTLQDRIEPYLGPFDCDGVAGGLSVNAVISSYVSRRFQRAILAFYSASMKPLCGVELDVTMSTVKEGILSIDKNGILRLIKQKRLRYFVYRSR
ncbi:hypothetical protein O9929_21270 [Vibrio lentus]|nr:hypothetical protein [Vibrio lentus]